MGTRYFEVGYFSFWVPEMSVIFRSTRKEPIRNNWKRNIQILGYVNEKKRLN